MDLETLRINLDILLKNESPMGAMEDPFHFMRKGLRLYDPPFNNTPREVKDMFDYALVVKNVYAAISISELTPETGREIIEHNKPLVADYFQIIEPLWESYLSSGFQAQQVPTRVLPLLVEIDRGVVQYGCLPSRRLYERAWEVGYFSHGFDTRPEWFFSGKKTLKHPEQLPLVLTTI